MCQDLGVENEYKVHDKRIRKYVVVAFLVLHSILTTIQCIMLLVAVDVSI